MLSRLVYVSRAFTPRPADLHNILEASRRNNPGLGLTGALCLLDGVYLQYLEGETPVLNRLYRKIEGDTRHFAAVVIELARIEQRMFPRWSMALLTESDEAKAIFEKYSLASGLDLYTLEPSMAAPLFEALAATSNWAEI